MTVNPLCVWLPKWAFHQCLAFNWCVGVNCFSNIFTLISPHNKINFLSESVIRRHKCYQFLTQSFLLSVMLRLQTMEQLQLQAVQQRQERSALSSIAFMVKWLLLVVTPSHWKSTSFRRWKVSVTLRLKLSSESGLWEIYGKSFFRKK